MIGVATPAIDHAGLVDADLNTLATPLEVTIDDELKMCPELARFRPEIGLCPKLLMPSSHPEIVQALVGFTSETRFVRHGSAQPCHLFPEVSGHNKLLRRAAAQLHAVSVSPRRERELLHDTWLVDSTPVSAAKAGRPPKVATSPATRQALSLLLGASPPSRLHASRAADHLRAPSLKLDEREVLGDLATSE